MLSGVMAPAVFGSALKRLRRLLPQRPAPVILMYHRIADESFDPWGLAVSVDRFRNQLRWLRANRKLFDLHEFVSLHRCGALPANAAALTFDDGYACNAIVAAPLLAKHRTPATMYVMTDAVRTGHEFWWDELERLVMILDDEEISLTLPSGTLDVRLGPKQAGDRQWPPFAAPRTPRQSAYHQLWTVLRPLEAQQQRSVLGLLKARTNLSAEARESHRPMARQEIQALVDQGIDIGAHSITHPSLPARTMAGKRREIENSRDYCAAITGTAPRSFAYPYGDFDDECVHLVRSAGFESACTTVSAGVARRTNRYRLPRVQVCNWVSGEMATALPGR